VAHVRAQDVLAENQDLIPLKVIGVRNRPRPEYDPLNIPLGAFRLSPQLTVGESYDDNIYASNTAVAGDRITILTSKASVQSVGQHPSVSVSGGFTSQTYAHNTLENSLDWDGGASLADGLGYRTSVNAGATVVRSHLAREDPSSPTMAIEPLSFDKRGALLEVRHDFPRGNLDLHAELQSFEFHQARLPGDVRLSEGFRNRNELTVDLQGNFLAGPSTSAFVRVVHDQQNYQRDSQQDDLDRDAITDTLAGGTTFQLTNLMRGELGIGVLHLRNHDPRQGRQTTLALRSNIEMYLTQLLTATLTVERTTGPADIAGSSSYVGTSVTAGLDYELRRNLILSADVSRFRRAYTGIDAGATTSQGGIKAYWLLTRSLKARLGYTLSRRTSPLETYLGQNYTERVVGATLELTL
jgi:hypothetical protein